MGSLLAGTRFRGDLEGAVASVEVADSMVLEDEVAETWGRMKREITEQAAALADKDTALADKDATLERERSERAAAEERIAELERRLGESGGADD